MQYRSAAVAGFPFCAGLRMRTDRGALPSGSTKWIACDRRGGAGRGDHLFRHGALLRHRPRRTSSRCRSAGQPARKRGDLDQGGSPAAPGRRRAARSRQCSPTPCPSTSLSTIPAIRPAPVLRGQPAADRYRSGGHPLHSRRQPPLAWRRGRDALCRGDAERLTRRLAQLRSEGRIGAIGVGMNDPAMLARFARDADFDLFMLAGRYTLLDQSSLDELLPVCAPRAASAIVAAGPFNSGILATGARRRREVLLFGRTARNPRPDPQDRESLRGPWRSLVAPRSSSHFFIPSSPASRRGWSLRTRCRETSRRWRQRCRLDFGAT